MSRKKSSTTKCKSYTEQARAIDRRIDKLEKGNTFDLVLAEKRIDVEARAVYDAIMVGTPGFIAQALLKALTGAANSRNLPVPDHATGEKPEEAIRKIADIFTIARNHELPDENSAPALAAHLSAVMKHPLTPTKVRDALADELSDLLTCIDHYSPEQLEKCLIIYSAQCQQEEAKG